MILISGAPGDKPVANVREALSGCARRCSFSISTTCCTLNSTSRERHDRRCAADAGRDVGSRQSRRRTMSRTIRHDCQS